MAKRREILQPAGFRLRNTVVSSWWFCAIIVYTCFTFVAGEVCTKSLPRVVLLDMATPHSRDAMFQALYELGFECRVGPEGDSDELPINSQCTPRDDLVWLCDLTPVASYAWALGVGADDATMSYRDYDTIYPDTHFIFAHAHGESRAHAWTVMNNMENGALVEAVARLGSLKHVEESVRTTYEAHSNAVRDYFSQPSTTGTVLELKIEHVHDTWHELRTFIFGDGGRAPWIPAGVPVDTNEVMLPLPLAGFPFPRVEGTSTLLPSVAIVIPTMAHRMALMGATLERIAQQDYPNIKEVIIVEDFDSTGRLQKEPEYLKNLPESLSPGLVHRYGLRQGVKLGEKRNFAAALSRSEVIVHWDDDDIYGPNRVTLQVTPIAEDAADMTIIPSRYMYLVQEDRLMESTDYNLGYATLTYRRRVIEENPFNEGLDIGEDLDFVERVIKSKTCRILKTNPLTPQTFIYVRHRANTWGDLSIDTAYGFGYTHFSTFYERQHILPAKEIVFYQNLVHSGELARAVVRRQKGAALTPLTGNSSVKINDVLCHRMIRIGDAPRFSSTSYIRDPTDCRLA